MIRNTFTQSGELAIISGVKFFVPKFIKSLQVRVTVILSVFVILSSVILMNAILQSYDQRTVSVRTAEIQNQCTILSNHMYVWGVIMILELIYMGVGISNLILDPSSKGVWPAVISAVCVLTAGILSIRREWKTKTEGHEIENDKKEL